jgi:xyloglucan-specific exo-beta-1,4-glucanase
MENILSRVGMLTFLYLRLSTTQDGGYPAIYAAAIVDDVFGYYRSDDEGATWVQINDAAHGFANPSSNRLAADTENYGRYVFHFCFLERRTHADHACYRHSVYLGAGGRGIFYGDAA